VGVSLCVCVVVWLQSSLFSHLNSLRVMRPSPGEEKGGRGVQEGRKVVGRGGGGGGGGGGVVAKAPETTEKGKSLSHEQIRRECVRYVFLFLLEFRCHRPFY
jgi:hypothetical protein